jgi:hypothetical protein
MSGNSSRKSLDNWLEHLVTPSCPILSLEDRLPDLLVQYDQLAVDCQGRSGAGLANLCFQVLEQAGVIAGQHGHQITWL